jgi:hypothetical protein
MSFSLHSGSISRILEPSPQGLIYSVKIRLEVELRLKVVARNRRCRKEQLNHFPGCRLNGQINVKLRFEVEFSVKVVGRKIGSVEKSN